ncbi:trypsin-like serine protease [Bacillus cereus]
MLPTKSIKIPPNAWDALSSLKKTLEEGSSSHYRFGIGYKRIEGKCLDQLALIVYVPNKKPPEEVSSSQLVPIKFEGFSTDVVELRVKFLTTNDNKPYDPLRGGIEIGNFWVDDTGLAHGGGSGTLGCIAKRRSDGELLFLTAEHVASSSKNGTNLHDAVGKKIYQPSWINPSTTREIGTCVDSSETYDAAIIQPNSNFSDKISCKIEEIGAVKGKFTIDRNTKLNYGVGKRGRTTGWTSGAVIALIPDDQARQPVGIEIVSADAALGIDFAAAGDSGAAIVNSNHEVVGILTNAYNDDIDPFKHYAFATLIDPICDALGIDIAVCP